MQMPAETAGEDRRVARSAESPRHGRRRHGCDVAQWRGRERKRDGPTQPSVWPAVRRGHPARPMKAGLGVRESRLYGADRPKAWATVGERKSWSY